MISNQDDIASKLLQSTDARIAEAAKRVFAMSNSSVMSSAIPGPSKSIISGPLGDKSSMDSLSCHLPSDQDQEMGGLYHSGAGGSKHTTNIKRGPIKNTASNEDVSDDFQAGDKKPSSTERLQRSRERNRMHARKTRQRKKEHMQKLQNRADELKLEQIRLKQSINEKNTANILVRLFQTGEDGASATDTSDEDGAAVAMVDPQVEVLLKRSTEEIPDASNIPELPALILPGQHTKRKSSSSDGAAGKSTSTDEGATTPEGEAEEDGIDYALLGKDRGSCTPAELDQIRRERNRMHAKRTRDRKRIFMEEMETMIKQLEDENALLQAHMNKLNESTPDENIAAAELLAATAALSPPQTISPEFGPLAAPSNSLTAPTSTTPNPLATSTEESQAPQSSKGDFLNQIESLLAAAGAFERGRSECDVNAISISCAASDVTDQSSFGEDDHSRPSKKQRHIEEEERHASVPKSITTTNLSL